MEYVQDLMKAAETLRTDSARIAALLEKYARGLQEGTFTKRTPGCTPAINTALSINRM